MSHTHEEVTSETRRLMLLDILREKDALRKERDELLEVVRLVLRIADGDSDLQRQLALDQNSPLVDAVREAISKAECKV